MKSVIDLTNRVKGYTAAGKTIADVENGATAVGSYAIGEQFIREGVLYKAKTAITAGDTLTLNTNYELDDPVMEQLNSQKQALSDEVETRATLGAHQLLDVNDNSNPINVAIANNGIVSTNTDTRAANIWVKCYKGNTAVGDLLISADLTVGKFKRTFTIPSNYDFDTLWIGHNGATRDLKAKIAFNKTGSFKFICNVTGANTSVSGGYALENILICLATDNDETYQPYAMTNKELTDVAEQLDGKYIVDANKKVSVTADGTKTYAELLAELYTAYKIISDATANDFLRITDLYIGGYDNFIPSRLLQTNTTLGIPSALRFETVLGDAAQVITHYVTFGASSGTVRMTVVAATASGNSITTKNEEVPTSGKIITITYDLYKKIS